MGILTNQSIEQISIINPPKHHSYSSNFPVIDLSMPGNEAAIVKACEEPGFFKVTNHRVSKELMAKLEREAVKFFSLPQVEKEKAKSHANPFGYGNKRIGPNGDLGWVEHLLFEINSKPMSSSLDFLKHPSATLFCSALVEYISAVRNLASEILELIAQGLGIKQRDVFSRLVLSEESDLMLRLNHYPPCPVLKELTNCGGMTAGFGEHTDPQVISILRSNNSNGFQILRDDGVWVSVPPDEGSFFINVGDTLQVLTNGRFKSVRHRVLTSGSKSRVSMIFFGGASPAQTITPLPQLMEESREKSRYIEFTWDDYKKAAYRSRLADDRLALFEKK